MNIKFTWILYRAHSLFLRIIKILAKLLFKFIVIIGENRLATSAFFFIVLGFLVLKITINEDPSSGFAENLLSEFFGVVFDIFIFGILIAFFNLWGERRRDIKRWQEEIDDYRGWKEPEALHRIVGNIKRLNRYRISKIDLAGCFLEKAILNNSDFSGSNLCEANLREAKLFMATFSKAKLSRTNLYKADLRGTDFHEADLDDAELSGIDFYEANLSGANLSGANLSRANLHWTKLNGADLSGANLLMANLDGANLSETNLLGANLSGADLSGARNITVHQLSKSKTLFNTKLDPTIEQQIKKKYPLLLEEPIPRYLMRYCSNRGKRSCDLKLKSRLISNRIDDDNIMLHLPKWLKQEKRDRICDNCSQRLFEIKEGKCPYCKSTRIVVPPFRIGPTNSLGFFNYYCENCHEIVVSKRELK